MKESPLTLEEVAILAATFPELSWMKPDDWQSVAACCDWDAWIGERWAESRYKLGEEHLALRDALTERRTRIEVRSDCQSYFGAENAPNINDPDDPTCDVDARHDGRDRSEDLWLALTKA